MAKEKKRGFFSWLGFGKEEQAQPPAEVPQHDAVQQPEPDVDESAHARAEAQAEAHAEHTAEATHDDTDAAPITHIEEEILPEEEVTAQPDSVTAHQAAVLPEDLPETGLAPVEPEPQQEAHLPEPAIVVPEDASQPATQAQDDAPLSDEELEALALAETYAEDAEAEVADTVSDLPLAAAPLVAQEQERPTKEGFFARLKRSLVKTRENLGSGFVSLFRGKKIDDDLFDELEEQLLIADVGVETTRRIITSLTQQASRKQLRDAEALYGLLKTEMSEILNKVDAPLDVSGKTPFVILMVGVNGVGKTTTIGKLARQYQSEGKSVMLAAGDTFRAAAVEQLQVWGQRNNIPVVAQHTGADSASVIFDAIQAAKARNVDVLIADTAGRLQNKAHLMEELKKITRVMKKLDNDAPHEVMLTLDASTGQNAISQAKLFNDAVGLSGIALTKLDGTAKGGVIFSIADQFGIPIRYIGVGEGIEDLRPFKAGDFIEALFAREE
ncbi:signal recognition particle-docking protein FtsY [Pantoea sp. Mb-10]|uniref:signal recognition particle-docking protein FtsY n=1 Tax=unclassified Pantoea TaxID=2630326 RepID=UPI001E2BB8D1|nr:MULTISPECIES: signal recognition particle-docking protein FtsY [unclassified Pantoea]MCE0490176.1 signal recognition particle-docking protein FtsY [Pantoea sp. Mb-10]MCE0501307.1 signal recognition particle-docking protein FtsY [Pantoea sp. Pb-8]